MEKLSVVILAKNEESNIHDCLEGLKTVDEVIVIDDHSTDRTLEVIKSLGMRNVSIVTRGLSHDFAEQRNHGLSIVKNDWVLFVDADERISHELLAEIDKKIQDTDIKGFWIKRKDVLWGKELKHGEVGNIRFIRLGRSNSGKWSRSVHEVWNVNGKTEVLDNSLMHYPHQTVREFLAEINTYSTLRANELHRNHEKPSLFQIVAYPKAKFFVNYFLKLGILDGIPGFVFAVMMSLHSFLVRSKLWKLSQK